MGDICFILSSNQRALNKKKPYQNELIRFPNKQRIILTDKTNNLFN